MTSGKSARQLNWSVGTVSAMKADVIHAGPPTEAYRVVMFFVACKGGQTYDADFQVSPFVFPLLLRSMDQLATLKYCSMYTDRKPWEFLEDVLDVDGISAVKGYSLGQMKLKAAVRILSKSLNAFSKRLNKEDKSLSRRGARSMLQSGAGAGGAGGRNGSGAKRRSSSAGKPRAKQNANGSASTGRGGEWRSIGQQGWDCTFLLQHLYAAGRENARHDAEVNIPFGMIN